MSQDFGASSWLKFSFTEITLLDVLTRYTRGSLVRTRLSLPVIKGFADSFATPISDNRHTRILVVTEDKIVYMSTSSFFFHTRFLMS
jgi:hypothetical protein